MADKIQKRLADTKAKFEETKKRAAKGRADTKARANSPKTKQRKADIKSIVESVGFGSMGQAASAGLKAGRFARALVGREKAINATGETASGIDEGKTAKAKTKVKTSPARSSKSYIPPLAKPGVKTTVKGGSGVVIKPKQRKPKVKPRIAKAPKIYRA